MPTLQVQRGAFRTGEWMVGTAGQKKLKSDDKICYLGQQWFLRYPQKDQQTLLMLAG
jgi:hypothetical protein